MIPKEILFINLIIFSLIKHAAVFTNIANGIWFWENLNPTNFIHNLILIVYNLT
jgi:hypothetical protein